QPAAMLLLSSMAAGIATTPIAAAHFNRIADYGLVANLVAVPIMGMLVMPAGVIAALLAPLGLAWLPLGLMGIGCELILGVATGVAGLEGSVTLVPAPPWGVLALLATGGFVLLVARPLWLRGAGGAAAALAILLWAGGDRPLLLVAADGGLTGVLGPAGRALSKPKGAGFVAKSWLEDDGDGATQEAASARPGFRGARGDLTATVAGLTVRHLTGKGASDRMADACTDGALVVTTEVWEGPAPADCIVFDRRKLEITGALAIHAGPKIVTARETAGDRIWNRPPGTERRLARSQ
ncbi:MAG: ComEC/Rec2 family competence protein, partial [Albidovulum sp.]